jgi:hypothetical protein
MHLRCINFWDQSEQVDNEKRGFCKFANVKQFHVIADLLTTHFRSFISTGTNKKRRWTDDYVRSMQWMWQQVEILLKQNIITRHSSAPPRTTTTLLLLLMTILIKGFWGIGADNWVLLHVHPSAATTLISWQINENPPPAACHIILASPTLFLLSSAIENEYQYKLTMSRI